MTSQAILGLHKGSSAEVSGEIWLDGKELVRMREGDMRALRGNEMAMIFQDPLSSLHPFYTDRRQIVEAYRVHNKVEQGRRAQARASRCWSGSASRSRRSASTTTRTSSRAACASAR